MKKSRTSKGNRARNTRRPTAVRRPKEEKQAASPRRSAKRRTTHHPVGLEQLEERLPLSSEGPVVSVMTNLGEFQIQLRQDVAPNTVANFLNYADSGAYNNSIFHRSVPGFVIQTGGFTTSSDTFTNTSQFTTIPTNAPIQSEADLSNTLGTVAMALSGTNANSATDEWFINMADNSSILDKGNTVGNPPFTVFGDIISGMNVVDSIAGVPVHDESGGNTSSPFSQLPIQTNNQLVVIQSIVVTGSISGTVFADVHQTGTDVSGDPGLAGVTVYLDANNSGQFQPGDVSTTTDGNGNYTFANLDPGNYTVRAVLPSGWNQTSPTSGGANSVVLAANENAGAQNFAFFPATPSGLQLLNPDGSVNSSHLTNENNTPGKTLTFDVSGAANGATVQLLDGPTVIGQATSSGGTVAVTTNGTFTLTDGSQTITAQQTIDGATSTVSAGLTITVDTTPPMFTSTPPSRIEAGVPLNYQAKATDPENQAITYSLVSPPSGMTINTTTGVITWLPNAVQAGNQSVDIQASDPAGNTADQMFTIFVHDTPPVLAPISPQTVNETSTLQFTVSASDINLPSDHLFFSLGAGAPAGATIDPNTGLFNWTPPDGSGPNVYPVVIRVTDAAGNSDQQTVPITVNFVNFPPQVAPIGNQQAFVGGALSFQVQATDPNIPRESLSFSLEPGAPAGASINPQTGVFTWQVPSSAINSGNRVVPITVRVTNSGNPPASATVGFQIVLVNPLLLFNTGPVGTGFLSESGLVGQLTFLLQNPLSAGQLNPLNPRDFFPFDPFAESGQANVVLGPDTGVPHIGEDEELLRSQRITTNKPTGEGNPPPQVNPPTQPQPEPDEEGRSQAPADAVPVADSELPAVEAIVDELVELGALDRRAIDAAIADAETLDELPREIADLGERGMAVASAPAAGAVAVMVPAALSQPRMRRIEGGRGPKRRKRVERLERRNP